MKILMVCLGNICRSPLAEGILKDKAKKAGLNWTIGSAGTNSYHMNEAPHALSQKIAKINGIDISRQRKKKFVPTDFEHYDKIYAMADNVLDDIKSISGKKFNSNKADLLMNELFPGENVSIPDPFYGEEKDYYEVYKLIADACAALVNKQVVSSKK